MRRPAGLPDRLQAELEPTLQLAVVLTGSTPGAIELAAAALAGDPSWVGADDGHELLPRLRTTVVRAFLSAPLGRSRPPATATGLDALAGPARTAVLLRDGERLTIGEIAGIMDRPGRRVAADLGATPAGAHDGEIAVLRRVAPSPAQVADRYAATSRRLRSRRRTRTALLAAAGAVLAAAVAVPTMIIPSLPHDVRPLGQWRFSHEVRPLDGWQIRYRSITADTEVTGLSLPQADPVRTNCTVTVTTSGETPRRSGPTTPTTVAGRPGVLVDEPGTDLALNWRYAEDAWAAIECPAGPATESLLRRVAGAVRFDDRRQLLPFTLTALPASYRIRMVGQVDEAPDWGPFVVLDPPDDSYWPVLLIGPHTSTDGASDDGFERCLGADRTVCVTAAQSDDQIPVNRGIQSRVLSDTVGLVRLAPDPADRSTWFDAIDLPS